MEKTTVSVYVGNLDLRVTERDLEDEFLPFGVLSSIWVARSPPGYGFVNFDDLRDAQDAIRELDGKNGWKVELSRNSGGSRGGGDHGRGGRGRSGSGLKCYVCGEPGHFARTCKVHGTSGRRRTRSPPKFLRSRSSGRSPRGRSPQRYSPRRRSRKRYRRRGRSPKRYSPRGRSPKRCSPRGRSPKRYSPRGRSPKRHSPSTRRRSYSRSPGSPRHEDVPYSDGPCSLDQS